MSERPSQPNLREVALLFLRLGLTAFGGPAAHIAMMQHEVVERRGWLAREHFLDLLGATNFIPGPNSTEMALHVGQHRAGAKGLAVAGVCFILPAAMITLAFAWAYTRFGSLPRFGAALYAVKPVIVAVVLQALLPLGRTALKSRALLTVAMLCAAASFVGVDELVVLLAAGITCSAIARYDAMSEGGSRMPGMFTLASGSGAGAVALGSASNAAIFLSFLKIGSVLFGSGYVLLAFLRQDLVEHRHWLTEAQLLDAVAVGQVTPGPVFTTATFVGYLLHGVGGAAAATIGIFAPAFFFVALSGPLVARLRRSAGARSFLDGLNAASLALMAVVTIRLGRAALTDAPTVVIFLISAVLLIRWRVNSVWLVFAGAAFGALVRPSP